MIVRNEFIRSLFGVVAFMVAVRCAKADPFANLDFEASQIPGNATVSSSVSTSLLFPSWTARIADAVQTTGYLNEAPLAGPAIALGTSNVPGEGVIEGEHSAYLQAWVNGITASIAQSGDVPLNAQSLRFIARNPVYDQSQPILAGRFDLQMNEQSVPLVTLSTINGDVLYGADISAWAGTTSELRIVLEDLLASQPYTGYGLIDAITFSPDPVPEPASSLLVFSLGVAFFMQQRR